MSHLICDGMDHLQLQIETFFRIFKHIILKYQPSHDVRKTLNEALRSVRQCHEQGTSTDELTFFLYQMLTGFCEGISSFDSPKDKKINRDFKDFVIICLFGYIYDDTSQHQTQEQHAQPIRPYPNSQGR